MAEKTKICCLDVEKEIVEFLEEDHELYFGTIGCKVSMSANRFSSVPVQPNYRYPSNIQEYDVFVVDMANTKVKAYLKEDYASHNNETSNVPYIACYQSVGLFNPIPYGAHAFHRLIQSKKDRRPIIIVFQDKEVRITYNWYSNTGHREETRSNFDFIPSPLYIHNIDGCQVRLVENQASESLFRNRLDEMQFHCAFDYVGQSEYVPLLLNKNGDCVSYIYDGEDALVIMLPQMNDKTGFLKMLFEDFLYEYFSEYFPAVEEKRWIHNEEYMLPNEEKLYGELEQARKDFEAKQAEIQSHIAENADKYAFLQTLITGTGEELVEAVIKYLEWLGYKDVVNADQDAGREFNEEDIRITIPNGLFILEVKGIHHNSTDDECARVGKYKLRRMEELQSTNVKALYVVNHQRNVEPLKRDNPPFTEVQKNDAKNGYRGLVTTWQLYNLFYDIENGIFKKEEAREAMMQYGWVEFIPKGAVTLGVPYRYCKNNVICLELNGQNVTIGDELFAYDGRHWHKVEVKSIQVDKQDYESIDKGHVGLGLSGELPEKAVVYVRTEGEK